MARHPFAHLAQTNKAHMALHVVSFIFHRYCLNKNRGFAGPIMCDMVPYCTVTVPLTKSHSILYCRYGLIETTGRETGASLVPGLQEN